MTSERFIAVADEDELARLLSEAGKADRGVLIGGGLEDTERLPGEEEHLAIGLGQLTDLVAFEPDDLTVTAQAGMSVGRLTEVVAERGQRLAIEVARPAARSLGGAVALNEDGFIAALYGELREQVLGMRTITGDGRLMRAGGRVVKNVTGYDIRKLLCGSAGSLAAITELSFRLRPQAASQATFALTAMGRDEALDRAGAWRDLPVKISGLALERDRQGYALMMRAEGADATLAEISGHLSGAERLEENPAELLWQELGSPGPLALRLRFLPSRLDELIAALPENAAFVTDLMAGRMRLPAEPDETAHDLIERTRGRTIVAAQNLLAAVEGDLEDTRLRHERFGSPSPGELALSARICGVFDPRGILMRGRIGAGLP